MATQKKSTAEEGGGALGGSKSRVVIVILNGFYSGFQLVNLRNRATKVLLVLYWLVKLQSQKLPAIVNSH